MTTATSGAPANGPWTMRRFVLLRHIDVTGVAGLGVVAEGIQFTDRSVSLRWRGEWPVTAAWPSIDGVIAIHGHDSGTEIRWIDSQTSSSSDAAPRPAPDAADWYGELDWGAHDDPERNR